MRAVVIRQFGEPRQLKIEEMPTPEPGADEVLVEVKAAAINPSDVKNVMGVMHGTTLPRIPGRDFAGTVVRGPAELLGSDVWGTGGDIGFTRDGSHAQFLRVPIAATTPRPAALPIDAAGASGVTFVTAWSAMVVASGVAEGETVAVIGAAGGVGLAAVQIARARGARVIGAIRSTDDFSAVRKSGAEEVIDTKSTNLVVAVRSFTGGRGADVVFDASGMMFTEAVEVAALHGRIPVIGAPKGGAVSFNLQNLYRKQLRVQGVDTRGLDGVASARLLAQMLPGFESGQYRPHAFQSRPLSAAVEAYEEAARGGNRFLLRPDL